MQFYTANYVDGIPGKAGAVYLKQSGICLETQVNPQIASPAETSVLPNLLLQRRSSVLLRRAAPSGALYDRNIAQSDL